MAVISALSSELRIQGRLNWFKLGGNRMVSSLSTSVGRWFTEAELRSNHLKLLSLFGVSEAGCLELPLKGTQALSMKLLEHGFILNPEQCSNIWQRYTSGDPSLRGLFDLQCSLTRENEDLIIRVLSGDATDSVGTAERMTVTDAKSRNEDISRTPYLFMSYSSAIDVVAHGELLPFSIDYIHRICDGSAGLHTFTFQDIHNKQVIVDIVVTYGKSLVGYHYGLSCLQ